MQCPVCMKDDIHDDALLCPYCKNPLRDLTPEEKKKYKKEAYKVLLRMWPLFLFIVAIAVSPFLIFLL